MSARSEPSVSPKKMPYTPNSAHACHAAFARPNPRYTAAYSIHPAMSVGRRPIRSESAPPGVFDAVFTRWSTAQRMGASATGTPSWLARSRRKASVELPSVKTKITVSTRQNRAPSGSERSSPGLLGACVSRGMSRTPNATTSTASTPGIAASQNTVRSPAMCQVSTANAISGPTTPPALSAAR